MISVPEIDPALPVLIAGPTASGKSALALELATRHNGVIINADALQVYACWRVLTARPGPEDEAAAPHMLYGHVPCDRSYSVGAWLRDVAPLIHAKDGRLPIIVGGTGLYFTALVSGLAEIPDIPGDIRTLAQDLIERHGIQALLDELHRDDPQTWERIDRNNPVRIQRAWEVLRATGRGLAAWQDDTPPPLLPLSQTNALVIEAPRDWLNARISRRFRAMVEQGALEECRANIRGWDPARPSAKAIGAAELIDHLRGNCTLEQAIERAEIATRQYAKRQRSWFRARMKGWQWISAA